MKFKYKKLAPGVLRPIIPIQLNHQGKAVWYEALVDSGADENIFHAEVGKLLDIDIEAGKQRFVGGITGVRKPTYQHNLEISIGGLVFTVPVSFSYGISNLGYGVLGQQGFFDLFVVKFDYQKAQIELKQK